MKVLQINCVYKRGSTGKIIHDIHKELLDKDIKSIICYGRGQKEKEINVYKTSNEVLAKYNSLRGRIIGLPYVGCGLSTMHLLKIIKKENPDIVHLHCINGSFVNIYRLVNFLKVRRIKTVLTLHAEFMHTGNCGYAFECEKWKEGCGNCPQLKKATGSYFLDRTRVGWHKMYDSFSDFNKNLTITAVSGWLADRAKESPIFDKKDIYVVENGVDTKNIFHYREYSELKKELGITNEKILLHVTASFTDELDDIKGGRYILEIAKRLEKEHIKIVVISNVSKNMNLPTNIINIGRIIEQKKLAQYYSMADLTLLVSKKETFSMICAESLSCGTPVVGFKAGAPETISLKEYSEFVDYGEVDKLVEVIKERIDDKMNIRERLSERAINHYSKENMTNNYLRIYDMLTNVGDYNENKS